MAYQPPHPGGQYQGYPPQNGMQPQQQFSQPQPPKGHPTGFPPGPPGPQYAAPSNGFHGGAPQQPQWGAPQPGSQPQMGIPSSNSQGVSQQMNGPPTVSNGPPSFGTTQSLPVGGPQVPHAPFFAPHIHNTQHPNGQPQHQQPPVNHPPHGGPQQPLGGYPGAPQPPGGAPQPPSGAHQPPMGAPNPPMGAPQPPSGAHQPPMGAPNPPMGAPQPPSGAHQPPMGAPHPPMGAPQPPSGAHQPPMGAPQPPSVAHQPPTGAQPPMGVPQGYPGGNRPPTSMGAPQPPLGPPSFAPQGMPGMPPMSAQQQQGSHSGFPSTGYPPMMGGPPGPPSSVPSMSGPYPGGPPSQMGGPPPMMGGPPGPPGQMSGGPPMMSGGGYAGGPPGMPQQRQQRLDPNLMPSVVQLQEDDLVRSGLFPTGQPYAENPPLTSTPFFSQDQGNTNPRMMRSSLYVAPHNQDLLKTTQIPFVFAISPFAKLDERERSPPLIEYEQGPVRCARCKAYMCPYMEFIEGGTKFRCPFCTANTTVDQWYFAHLDHTGRRSDAEHRPELYYGAYEYGATKQYCKNGLPPKEPAFIFMIDVSYNALNNGLVSTICANLESLLDNLPKELGMEESLIHIGLAAFDQNIHFFDLSSIQPRMLVISDVEDVFVPIVDGLLLPLSQARSSIRSLLSELPKIFDGNKVTTTILGPVVQAGLDALKCCDRSGKLFVFTSSLPLAEAPGKLKPREDRKLLGTDKEKTILTPQTEFYTKLGESCVRGGCCVDLFLFPNSFIDVATIAQLSAITGGSIYKYQYFEAGKDSNRFLYDLSHSISKQIAFDVMVRIRSSAGIRAVAYSGSFFMENTTDIEIAAIDEDKTLFAELRHDDKLNAESAVVQAAVLYTSCSGRRRLRILNICMPVSSDYNGLYRTADHETIATYLLKNAIEANREKGHREMKESLAARTAKILAAYREKCSVQSPLGQLILPESLKLLPLYVNSIMKHDALAGGNEMAVDDKAWMIEIMRGVRVEDAMRLLYPKIIAVSSLEMVEGEDVILPTPIRASIEFFQNDSAYLIDNGLVLFLWLGLNVPQKWIQDVFGVGSIALVDTETHVVPEKDNSSSRALRRAISLIDNSARKKKIFIIREKETLEQWMKKFLIEDKTGTSGMSYVDFLCYIHKEIRSILS